MKSERLAVSGIIGLAGSAFSAIGALVLTAIVAQGLGPYGTGLFFQAIGIFTIATQVLNLGTSSGLIRFISRNKALEVAGGTSRLVWVALVPVGVAAVGVAVAATWASGPIAAFLSAAGAEGEVSQLIEVLAPYVVVMAVLNVLQTSVRMTRGLLAFSILQDVLLPLGRLALVLLAVLLGWSAAGTVHAWAAALPFWLLITVGLLWQPLRRDQRRRVADREAMPAVVRRFWGYSWARAVGGALEITLAWVDVLIVAALTSPVEAGVYAVATRAVRAGQVVDRAMRLAVSPRIAELLTRGEIAAATGLHTAVSRAMILCTWPFYLTLATLGPSVMLLFGASFVEGGAVLAILSAVMMAAAAAGMLQSILLMGGRSSWQMLNKAAAVALSVVGNLLLVPQWGILGAAITWAVVMAVDTGISAYLVHRRMGVHLQPRKLLAASAVPLVVFGGTGSVVRATSDPSVLVLFGYLLVVGLCYLVILWRFRESLGISPVWRQLPRPLRRRLGIT